MALHDAVDKLVRDNGVDEKFVTTQTPKEFLIRDAVNEITENVIGFPDWYGDEDDPRNTRVGGKIENLPNEIRNLVTTMVKENIGEIEADIEADEDTVVNDLLGYIANWENWYYEVKQAKDLDNWLESKGNSTAIYEEDRYGESYGDPDKSEGYGIYDIEGMPDAEGEYII